MKSDKRRISQVYSRLISCIFTRRSYILLFICSIMVVIQRYTTFSDSIVTFRVDMSSGLLRGRDLGLHNVSHPTIKVKRKTTVTARTRKARRITVTTASSNVSQLFNASCPVDVLGLPEYVISLCNKEPSLCQNTNLTCRNLLSRSSGKDPLYKYIKPLMLNHTRTPLGDDAFVTMTADCEEYRRARGFKKKEAIKEDSDFSIAFNLLVHKEIEMVERLIYGLYRRQHHFCLHIDTKASSSFKIALHSIARCLPNVFIASKLELVVYAGFSRLQADLNCMKDHLARSSDWKYVLNAPGESYPLRSQREMINILRIYNGTNDIEGIYGTKSKLILNRYVNEFIETKRLPKRIKQSGKKNPEPPHGIKIVKGSAYGAFSREFVAYLLTDQKSRDILNWMQTTYSPDEFYWATLHHRYINPQLRAPGGSFSPPTKAVWKSVYANWYEICYSRRKRGICITGVGDLPNIIKRPELFINKFHSNHEPVAIECLRAWIDHKELCPVEYNYDMYEQVARLGLRNPSKL